MSKGAKTSGAKAVSMIFVKFLAVAHASSARRGAVLTLACFVVRVSCVFRLFNTLFCEVRGTPFEGGAIKSEPLVTRFFVRVRVNRCGRLAVLPQ